VGAAGAEGFGPALGRADAQDAGNDEDVRAKDGQGWDNNVKCTEAQTYYLIDDSTGAGELQYWKKITEVMVYFISFTENQS
jgi:hypothetical protein